MCVAMYAQYAVTMLMVLFILMCLLFSLSLFCTMEVSTDTRRRVWKPVITKKGIYDNRSFGEYIMTIMIRMLDQGLSFNQYCYTPYFRDLILWFSCYISIKFYLEYCYNVLGNVRLHFKYSTCLCSCFGHCTFVILVYSIMVVWIDNELLFTHTKVQL